jgi:hypothetical protein
VVQEGLGARRLSCFASVLLLVSCGSRSVARPTIAPAAATPTVATQIQRAQSVGPGYLRFCPLQDGRASATFNIDVPGGAQADGWCQTTAARGPHLDVISFETHWDAVQVIGKSGTEILQYGVSRSCATRSQTCVRLVGDTGSPPP